MLLGEPPGYNSSRAVGINNHGDVLIRAAYNPFVVLMQNLIDEHPKVTGQDFPDVIHTGLESLAEKMSLMPAFRQKAFLWQSGKMHEIDGLALALNDCGQVVGWSGCDWSEEGLAQQQRPYAGLWQEGKEIDLNIYISPQSGWHLTKANSINNHGQIVGHGKFEDATRAFLLTPTIK
jgi:uncharacterized membrane protein